MNELVIFDVPELASRSIKGGGCCAVTSSWLIEDGISQLPGILEVLADDESGKVSVLFDPAKVGVRGIERVLEGLGLAPAGIRFLHSQRSCSPSVPWETEGMGFSGTIIMIDDFVAPVRVLPGPTSTSQ